VSPNALFLATMSTPKGGYFIAFIFQHGGEQDCIAFVPHCVIAWMCHPSFSAVTFFCDLHAPKSDESHYYESFHLD
jgi:hypothetical protein